VAGFNYVHQPALQRLDVSLLPSTLSDDAQCWGLNFWNTSVRAFDTSDLLVKLGAACPRIERLNLSCAGLACEFVSIAWLVRLFPNLTEVNFDSTDVFCDPEKGIDFDDLAHGSGKLKDLGFYDAKRMCGPVKGTKPAGFGFVFAGSGLRVQ
jgi:hypothetical protein